MRALVLGLSLAVFSGCVIDLENAPCEEDSQCPADQWCTEAGKCRKAFPTLDEACGQVVRIGAARAATCYGGAVASWRANLPGDQICSAVQASVTGGTLQFDASKIRQCKAAIATRPCEEISIPSVLEGCEMFVAKAGDGAACGTPYDCTAGWCKVSGACPGACVPFIADDQPCAVADKCAPGSACTGGTCRRLRGVGEVCSSDAPCQPFNSFCDGNPGTCQAKRVSGGCSLSECVATYRCTPPIFGGTCNPSKALGQPCTPGQYQCEALARCSNVTNQCEPYSETGGGCGLNFEGEIAICIGARCNGNGCVNFLGPGETCNADGDCGPLSHCTGVCVPEFCG